MGLFNGYLKEGKGVEKDAPKPIRPIYFFELFFRKFSKMVQLNLLFLGTTFPLWAILYYVGSFLLTNLSGDQASFATALSSMAQILMNPLTIVVLLLLCFLLGPSTAGATYILMNFANENPVFLCSDYFETFRKNFKQASFLMMFNVIATVSVLITWLVPTVQPYSQIPAIAMLNYFKYPILFVYLAIIFANFYAYSIMVKFKLKLVDIIKNSFIFSLGRLPWNILIFAVLAGILLLASLNYLIGMLAFILILYSLCGFLVVFSVYPTIEKYMLLPVQNKNEENSDF